MPRLASITSQALTGLGKLPPPSASFVVDQPELGNEVAEGQDLNIIVNTENVPDGTRLWWSVQDGGTEQFADWYLYQGDFIVNNGTARITVVPARDELAESVNETFRVVVRDNGSSSGPFLGRSNSFTVVDVPPNNLLITDFSNPFAGPANFPTGNSQIISGKGYVDTGSIFCDIGEVDADIYLIEFDVVTSDFTGQGFTGADAEVYVTYNNQFTIQYPLVSGSSGTQTIEIATTRAAGVRVEFRKSDAGLTVDNLWLRRKIIDYVYNGGTFNFGLLGWAIDDGPGSARTNAFNRLEIDSPDGVTTVYQNVETLEPNTTYRILFEVFTASGDYNEIRVYDVVNDVAAYTFTPTGAEFVDVDFTTPPITQFSQFHRLEIRSSGSIETNGFSIKDTGTNFVTNGDFETGDLTGWNDDGLITASVTPDNTLSVSSQNATQLDQNLNLVAGRTYRIRFDLLSTTGSTNSITIVNTFDSQPAWGYAPISPETVSDTFSTPNSSPPFYQLRIRPSAGSMELDNFIIVEE